MIIKNGYVIMPGGCRKTDISIENGVIENIGENLSGRDVIDASGKYVLPAV